MENRSGIYKEYEQNFLLDEPKLRKIVDIVREQAKKLSYETYIEFYVEQSENIYYYTHEIEEILQDDNTNEKAFWTLVIRLYKSEIDAKSKQKSAGEPKPIVYVAFTSQRTPKVRFSINCDNRDWTFLVSDELDTQVKRTLTKKPSKIFTPMLFDLLVAAIILILGVFLSSWFVQSSTTTNIATSDIALMTLEEKTSKLLEISMARNNSPVYPVMLPIMFSWVIGAFFAIMHPISNLIKKLSRSFFLWGDMITVYNKFEGLMTRVKWGVITAFIISIVSGLIVAFVAR